MPYIKGDDGRREALQKGEPAQNAGELNYQIFYYTKYIAKDAKEHRIREAITNFVKNFIGENPNYQKYNDMTGALIRCEREIKRRLTSFTAHVIANGILPDILNSYDAEINAYEDTKIESNGDV
ncbi:MAG: DUF6899 family protein [Promethearchaeota archaeon]